MKSLDYLADAFQRERSGDSGGSSWVWHHCMMPADRLRFDEMLVRTGDELAFRAGTGFHRFCERVRRMTHLAETGELS